MTRRVLKAKPPAKGQVCSKSLALKKREKLSKLSKQSKKKAKTRKRKTSFSLVQTHLTHQKTDECKTMLF